MITIQVLPCRLDAPCKPYCDHQSIPSLNRSATPVRKTEAEIAREKEEAEEEKERREAERKIRKKECQYQVGQGFRLAILS